MTEGVLQLYHDGLAFLLQPSLLWPFDPNNLSLWRQAFPAVIPDHFIMLNEKHSVLPLTGNNPFVGTDPGYHGSAHSQQLIADNWYQHWLTYFK